MLRTFVVETMPSLDVSNPRVINFLLENYEKESIIRMRWVRLHGDKIEQAATFTKEQKNYTPLDISKSTIEAGLAAVTRDHVTGARNRMTAPLADDDLVKTKKDVKKSEILMKPVSPDVKSILLESSKQYLKKRSLLKPDEKYNFVECSSWKHGWKMGESCLKMRGSEYGKVNHVMHNLRSRVGPQKDPDHYKSPDPGQKVYVVL